MTDAWESNFRKITTLAELPKGSPRVFRTGGATLVLRFDGEGVEAIDGSCLAEDSNWNTEARFRRILDCVASGVGSPTSEWDELVSRAALPVRVEEGSVWVCLDGCAI